MWKFVSRGIRESLERRVCRTNICSQSNDGESSIELPEQKEKTTRKPCLIIGKFRNYWGSEDSKLAIRSPCFLYFAKRHYKHLGASDRDEQRKYDAKQNGWTEAVGWSGVLALGYVVCQSLCLRRRVFDVDNSNLGKWKKKLIIDPHAHAAQILSNFLLPGPKYVLPITKSIVVNSQQQETRKSIESIKAIHVVELTEDTSEDLIDGAINIGPTYGPITAEEALEEAIQQFSDANEVVLGELEFNSGNIAIEQERYKDAVRHFTSGAEMSSPRCMFNLAVCYELGLGTEKDYRKAAKYYKKAATEGHADAMYNLGIYHAQGKGGLNVNLDAAKQWFLEAAEKGLIKAIKALQLSESMERQNDVQQKVKSHVKAKTIENINTNAMSQLVNYKNVFKTSIDTQTESDEFSTSYDEDLSSPSPTDMFLDMIGVHEQRAMSPLYSISDDNS